jgi:hypothetical protein
MLRECGAQVIREGSLLNVGIVMAGLAIMNRSNPCWYVENNICIGPKLDSKTSRDK